MESMPIKDLLRTVVGMGGKNLGRILYKLDRGLTVFLFHDISDEPAPFTKENNLCVPPEVFRKQIEFISSNFNVISMQALLKGDLPTRAAMITFDDGYAGIFKNAVPILGMMRVPCAVFLNMAPVFGEIFWAARVIYLCTKVKVFERFLKGHAGTPFQYCHLQCTEELVGLYERENGNNYLFNLAVYTGRFASLEDLEESNDNPMVTLGSHLYNHFNVKTLSNRALKEQYERNAVALCKFKRYIAVFAFPFGQPDTCFTLDQAAFLLRNGAIRLFTGWPEPNDNCSAKVIHRIALNSWHDRDSRLWFQIVKFPILKMFGKADPEWGEELRRV